jgi:hypothetical protein
VEDERALTLLPRLNLLGRPMLCGLCYRALAGAASADAAPLTARRLEHIHAGQTELLKRISALKGELGVLQEKTLRAQTESRQAMLDLQLFDEANPELAALEQRPRTRRKLTAEEAQHAQERAEQAELAKQAASDAAQIAMRAEQASRELLQAEARKQVARLERQRWEAQLLEEAAAWVLGLIAAGREDEARRTLAELRRLVRGELMVAVLFVVVELLTAGPQAMLQAIPEMKPIFEQHKEPLPRILSALAHLAGGSVLTLKAIPESRPAFEQHPDPLPFLLNTLERRADGSALLDREQIGMPPAAVFSQPAHLRLYTLICALAGWRATEMLPEGEPFRATLVFVRDLQGTCGASGGQSELQIPEFPISRSGDNVLRLLAANILLRRGEFRCVLNICGIELPAQPPRRGQAWPALLPALVAAPIPAWPSALAERVNAALACHVLLAARDCAPPGLYEAWLAESYGWPKDDFYWWTLACLEDDAALRRNITGSPDQLFAVPPV